MRLFWGRRLLYRGFSTPPVAPSLRLAGHSGAQIGRMKLIIVKRGALATFHFLERSCKDILGVRVIWDRRRDGDAAAGNSVQTESGHEERRKGAPHSWTAADHVLVSGEERDSTPSELGLEQVANQ